jgi:hypothetical protein
MPLGAEANDLVIQLHADAPAHADHDGLAVQGLKALLEVVHDVLGHEAQALLGSDYRLQLRPLGLEPLLAFDLLAFCDLLEFLVDPLLPLLRESSLATASRSK